MLTDFAHQFGDTDTLARALQNYIRSYPVSLSRGDGGWRLQLPGRPPYPWRAPRFRFRLRLNQPSGNLGESAEIAALDFVLDHSPARIFYDIGASTGFFSHAAAGRVDREMDVHAFDLRPELIQAIARTADALHLRGVTAHLSGLGRECRGKTDIWVSLTKMFDHEPDPADIRDALPVRIKFALQGRQNRTRPSRHQIMFDSIDAFSARVSPPDIVKMDIDGYEAEALPGGMSCFRQTRPVILLEIHRRKYMRRFGIDRDTMLRPLFELGYSALFLENRQRHKAVRVTPVAPGHPLLRRDWTDFTLLV